VPHGIKIVIDRLFILFIPRNDGSPISVMYTILNSRRLYGSLNYQLHGLEFRNLGSGIDFITGYDYTIDFL